MAAAALEELALLERLLGLPRGSKYGVQGQRKVKGARRGGRAGCHQPTHLPPRLLASPRPHRHPQPGPAPSRAGAPPPPGPQWRRPLALLPGLGGRAPCRPQPRVPARPALPWVQGFTFARPAPARPRLGLQGLAARSPLLETSARGRKVIAWRWKSGGLERACPCVTVLPPLSPSASASYPSAGAVKSVETDAGLISEMHCVRNCSF